MKRLLKRDKGGYYNVPYNGNKETKSFQVLFVNSIDERVNHDGNLIFSKNTFSMISENRETYCIISINTV